VVRQIHVKGVTVVVAARATGEKRGLFFHNPVSAATGTFDGMFCPFNLDLFTQ